MSQVSATIAHDLWRASWQGGIFILAVFALCRALPRIPAAARHWLWWIACLQLLLRLAVASPITLPVLPASRAPAAAAWDSGPGQSTVVEAVDLLPSAVLAPARAPAPSTRRRDAEPKPARDPFPVAFVLLSGWGVGVAAGLVLAARRLGRTRRLIRAAIPLAGPCAELVAALSSDLGLRPPRVLESDAAKCPMLAGWRNPTILVPTGFAAARTVEELRMAMAHELIHLKRRDLWIGAVPVATQVLFFFHPLAWLAVRESAAACEEACDVAALQLSGGSASAYARLLLSSAQTGPSVAAMGAAFGFRLLHRRITMLSQSVPLARPSVRRAVIALLALAAVCSVPWSVTAQTAKPVVHVKAKVAKHAKKPTHSAKAKHAAKRVTKHPKAKTAAILAPGALAPAIARTGVVTVRPFPAATRAPAALVGVAPTAAFPVRSGYAPRAGGAVPAQPGLPVAAPFLSSAEMKATLGGALPAPATSTAAALPTRTHGVWRDDSGLEVSFHDVDIYDAIEQLFKAMSMSFSIKSTVRHDKVTCSMRNPFLDDALETILATASQPLTYRIVHGVYQIMPKSEARADSGN